MRDDLSRRTVLRAVSIAALALGATPVLGACATQRVVGPGGGGPAELELLASDVNRSPAQLRTCRRRRRPCTRWAPASTASWPQPTGNLALSPYSVGVALALTLNGAKGATLEQMLRCARRCRRGAASTGG